MYDYENAQIDDVIDYVFDYYARQGRSQAFIYPDESQYIVYYKIFSDILTNTFGKKAKTKGTLYLGDSPLSLLVLEFAEEESDSVIIRQNEKELQEQLIMLDRYMGEQKQNVYIRRNIRVYQRDKIFIIKPAQRKYWTYSAACRDADETFADISAKWR